MQTRFAWIFLATLASFGAGCGDDALSPSPGLPPSPDAAPPDAGAAHDAGDSGARDAADAATDSDGDGTLDNVDCAPKDASRWRVVPDLFVDSDGDGRGVGDAAARCVGATTAGFTATISPPDCDDHDPSRFFSYSAYPDADGDAWGAGSLDTMCVGSTLPSGYSTNSLDCAPDDATRWQALAYSERDADHDTYTVHQAQTATVCTGAALPPGYGFQAHGSDCDDNDPTVFEQATLYSDTDHDGVGDGAPVVMCIGQSPFGYSDRGGDCDPSNASVWQSLPYAARDEDHDTYTVSAPAGARICAGAALPDSYVAVAKGADCNDHDPAVFASHTVYADTDGDKVGVAPPLVLCNDGSIPAGEAATGTDCAPDDASRWQSLPYAYVDRDGDGATVSEAGSVCAGASLPPLYSTVAQGNDCNDSAASLTHWAVLYPDRDHDGIGAGAYEVLCIGATIPAGYSQYGDDENDGDPAVGPLEDADWVELLATE